MDNLRDSFVPTVIADVKLVMSESLVSTDEKTGSVNSFRISVQNSTNFVVILEKHTH
jgi:hypothetical protein